MSLPLSSIVKDLESLPKQIIESLLTLNSGRSTLHTAPKITLKHLTSRSASLCKSRDPYEAWCGASLLYVISDNLTILVAEGGIFVPLLVKAIEQHNDKRVVVSAVESLNKLCSKIRGLPVLTREVLTPNIGSMAACYLEKIAVEPAIVINALSDLTRNHPTTMRPLANKIRSALLEYVGKETFLQAPTKVQKAVTSGLATLCAVEKEGPDVFWAKDVNKLLHNIAGALEIYSNLLNLKDDDLVNESLRVLSGSGGDEIFPSLHIDINLPETMFLISQRVESLFSILNAYISTQTSYTVVAPVGKFVLLFELLCAINTTFVNFKREVRDQVLKDMVNASLLQVHQIGCDFADVLVTVYRGQMVPYLGKLLGSLEQLVFVQGKGVDKKLVVEHEQLSVKILQSVLSVLSLVGHFADDAQLNKFVEVALILISSRVPVTVEAASQSNLKVSKHMKKKAKQSNGSVADLLTHANQFTETVSEAIKKAVLEFFETIVGKANFSTTHNSRLVKFLISEAIRARANSVNGQADNQIQHLLLKVTTNPLPGSSSILPITSSLFWNSDLITVMNNPRFPLLPVKAAPQAQEEDDDEDEDDNETVLPLENENRKLERSEPESEPEAKKPKLEIVLLEPVIDSLVLFKSGQERIDIPVFEELKVEVETAVEVQPEENEEEGSEIEIPDLDLDESDQE